MVEVIFVELKKPKQRFVQLPDGSLDEILSDSFKAPKGATTYTFTGGDQHQRYAHRENRGLRLFPTSQLGPTYGFQYPFQVIVPAGSELSPAAEPRREY